MLPLVFFIQWQPAELVFPCIFPSDPPRKKTRNVASNSVLRWKPCASAERFCFRSMQRQGHFCRTMSHLGAFPADFLAKMRWIRMIVWGITTKRLMFYDINHDLWERCCESGKVCWIKSSNYPLSFQHLQQLLRSSCWIFGSAALMIWCISVPRPQQVTFSGP